ncbi:integrator complex subunit 1-like [Mizuhopecten yessoensis]|uniref:Integrator complex subunit 1 n=1 Tax=Mizuhopecten yessoensis TaxID=6573 RepID=A0A210PWK7_MIZYE|nr:integrator complex subunit 1-like [Mizuhopecten yessoensis]OWF40859.1 Integrator complex subunit 1 [Mizuhopecten yessoensis]
MAAKRPAKAKVHIAPPGDFIALGKSKPSSVSELDVPRGVPSQVSSKKLLSSSGERKREAPSSSISGIAKRPKLIQGQTFTPLGRSSDADRRSSPAPNTSSQLDEVAIDIEPLMLMEEVLDAEDMCNDEKLEGLFLGAIKNLRGNRSKPDTVVYLTIMSLAKTHSSIFNSELIIQAFCSLLKRELSLNFKAKGNVLVSVFACNVLMAAFSEEENWPDDFVKVFVEDSLGERVWVDRSDCKSFVDNIITAFNTKLPSKSLSMSIDMSGTQSGSASPVVSFLEDDDVTKSSDSLEDKLSSLGEDEVTVFPRYPYQQDSIESYVMDIIREQLSRRQTMDTSSRNVIRLMTATSGYSQVRLQSAQRLEMWLQNPKLTRSAQELLMSLCMNCNQYDQNDIEVLSQLVKIRMKTKPLLNHFLTCIRELIPQHQENLRMMLTHTIYNELSNVRNPNNMALISVMFQTSSTLATKVLAEIFQDLLSNKEDYLRALRALLREIARTLKQDIKLSSFCLNLMQERTDSKFLEMDNSLRERYIMSVADMVAVTILIGITPSVREAKGDKQDSEVLHKYRQQTAMIQRDAVWWMHTIVSKHIVEFKPEHYIHCLHKVLFLEGPEQYYNKDNWPSEGERGSLLRIASESPVLEDTLMRILVIGLSPDIPINPPDAVELVDQLVKRAASLSCDGEKVLQMERLELVDALLNLCSYRHPTDISLPKGYSPPTLAISNLYWKSWIILLILSAFNPQTFGITAWENYPTLKCLMEMVMTRNYKFPPPTTASDEREVEDIKNQEKQVSEQEKQEILEFESHLAAATSKVTITETNSLLVTQLTAMKPSGVARQPPAAMLEQVRILNETIHIGQLLCRSRKPDFLLDIIQRQGASQSMPWLAELVEASEGSLEVLPVQCLCEFLLHDVTGISSQEEDTKQLEKHRKKQKVKKRAELVSYLRSIIHADPPDPISVSQVLDYFLRRLSSTQASNRHLAIQGLSMLISCKDTPEEEGMETESGMGHSWLLEHLPTLAIFPQIRPQICSALRQACQIETEPGLISACIIFLSQQALDQSLHELDDLALDMAQLIVERTTVINHILPLENQPSNELSHVTLKALIDLYTNYLRKAKEPDKEAYSWSNTQDQILLQWKGGDSATMHVLVVHAMIILLTYGPPKGGETEYQDLLDTWFPAEGQPPSAFLLDTSEEALLLPDWLKLRMIRSHVTRLVDTALQDIEANQLLLFVQSFGIPVASMGRLLRCLDGLVVMDSSILEQAVEDKTYMAQLIDIQHMRGAQGGNTFRKLLTAQAPVKEVDDAEMKSVESKDESVWMPRAAEQKKVPHKAEIISLLVQVFSMDGKRDPDTDHQFHNLVTGITSRKPEISQLVIDILYEKTRNDTTFRERFCRHVKACPLLKSLVASKCGRKDSLQQLMLGLSAADQTVTSPAMSIIKHFLLHSSPGTKSTPCLNLNDLAKKRLAVDEGHLESRLTNCMRSAMASQLPSEVVSSVCQTMIQTDNGDRSEVETSLHTLLLDWLELLDPELVARAPDLQHQLMFSQHRRQKGSKASGENPTDNSPTSSDTAQLDHTYSNQAYLLALLTHQSSWSALHRSINTLLQKSPPNRFCPTTVLDFLWACLQIPKIWQGREQKISKNQPVENVLSLSQSQLETILNYIVEEAVVSESVHTDGDHKGVPLSSRVELMVTCTNNEESNIKFVAQQAQEALTDNRNKAVNQKVLVELYAQCPRLVSWLPDITASLSDKCLSQETSIQVDLISFRLLTSLGHAGHGRRNEDRMHDANIACRKLASQHPLLMLRQLPMMNALLKGKTQFKIGQLRHHNYLQLFTHILGLMEAMQPLVFRREYTASHSDILESYLSLLQRHGMERVLAPIVAKFIRYLQNYMMCEPQHSINVLQPHVGVFSNLASVYPDMPALKSLLAGLTLPRQTESDSPHQGDMTLGLARPTSPWTVGQIAPYLQRLQNATDSSNILDVLQDLDETSKRKVDILEHFLGDLKKLLLDLNDKIRNTCYSLIMRYVRQVPRSAVQFLGSFLQCLDSDNSDIITSALKNLPEFCVLCQDHADVLLQKAFLVGTTTSIETSTYITEALQTLNLETTLIASKLDG